MKRVKEVQKELAESDRMCPPGRDWEFLSESGKLNMTIKKEWLNWFLINTPSKEKIMNIIKIANHSKIIKKSSLRGMRPMILISA